MVSLLLLQLLLASFSLATDYCSITSRHTMCQYQGLGPSCGGGALARGVTKGEREQILDTHNRLRALLARGEERRGRPGPQPQAADMRQMEWDSELARLAQRHADQCTFDHDCTDCRSVDRFGVGQNLYIYKQSLRLPATNWKRAVTDWYDEVRLFSRAHVEPFQFRAAIGHYSQLVWADTYKVGCGVTSYREGKWFSTLYTCNYGPNGNFIRAAMYKKGTACSACPSGTSCSSSYPGLCSSSAAPLFLPTTTQRTTTRRTTRRTTTRRTTTRRTTTRKTTPKKTFRRPATRRPPVATTLRTGASGAARFQNSSLDSSLFSCDFQSEDSCSVRNTGEAWSRVETATGNVFYQTELGFRQKTELFFKNTIDPPAVGVACLDFNYIKFSTEGHKSSLQVVAWPYRGKPGKISVFRDSPSASAWVRAQITFRKIDNFFLIMFRAGGPATKGDQLYIALDQVKVLPGKCQTAE